MLNKKRVKEVIKDGRMTEFGLEKITATKKSRCMGQVEGWTQFLCCLKAYLEYGVNLRVGGVIK